VCPFEEIVLQNVAGIQSDHGARHLAIHPRDIAGENTDL
jgi:hypothetical protein